MSFLPNLHLSNNVVTSSFSSTTIQFILHAYMRMKLHLKSLLWITAGLVK